MTYYGGIEGGTTGSRMVIVNELGEMLGRSEGSHTNYWHIGMEKCITRLLQLVDEALIDANLPSDTTLKVLGLSLSGVNTKENQNAITRLVRKRRPNVAEYIQACNDAIGALATATGNDAIILIAGTGSICKLVRRSMSYIRIGGLGYLLGDEGSAFWIAHRAITLYVKATEGIHTSPYNTDRARDIIFEHFGIKSMQGVLPFFGEKFDKTFIARICREFAEAAYNGDEFCKQLFYDAGLELGRHISAAARHADKEGLMTAAGIEVVCCGSVFKSWSLIDAGFREGIKPRCATDCRRGSLKMFRLLKTAAFGAAIVAAKLELNVTIPRPSNAVQFMCSIDMDQ